MTDPYLLWALLVGLAVGVAVTWFVIGRLPRRTDDVTPEERIVEAEWISSSLASRGTPVAPRAVEEVLELHEQYLSGPPAHLTPEEQAAIAAERARREEAATAAAARTAARSGATSRPPAGGGNTDRASRPAGRQQRAEPEPGSRSGAGR